MNKTYNDNKVNLSIIIPAYNEEKTIKETVFKIKETLKNCNYTQKIEFIIIDDGSNDSTWEVVKNIEFKNENIEITLIRFYRNFGKESAIYAGLLESNGEAVIVIDADGEHSPELIIEMLKNFEKGYELVEAVKEKRQKESFIKKFIIKIYFIFFKYLTGIDIKNSTDYKLMSRKIVELYIKSFPERQKFFRGLLKWTGIKSKKIYFTPNKAIKNKKKKSSWNFFKLFKFGWENIISFSIIPLRILFISGLLGVLIGLILLIETLYMKFSGKSVEGFTTVISLQILFSSGILLGIGILGEYIGKIYEEIKSRPSFLIQEKIRK